MKKPAKPPKIRLFLDTGLGEGQVITLPRETGHYLFNVMRLGAGDKLTLFNGQDGEWVADVSEPRPKSGKLLVCNKLAEQDPLPDIWLAFALIKKARLEYLIEKAVEIGVSRLLPITTEYTDNTRIRDDRLISIATEAAEQSRAMAVPGIAPLQKLDTLLADWPDDRALLFADEAEATGARTPFAPPPAALLIGPEGGFSEKERALIRAHPSAKPVSLGKKILRAETAALVGLALWHDKA